MAYVYRDDWPACMDGSLLVKIDQLEAGNHVKFKHHIAKLNIEISGDGVIRKTKGSYVYVSDGSATYEMGAASIKEVIQNEN